MSVMRRKIGRAGPQAGSAASPEAAAGQAGPFRLALARAARDCMGLTLEVSAASVTSVGLAELVDLPPDRALLAVLDRAGADRLGVLMVAPEVLAGMVEMLTTGRITASAAAPRRPTRTDAAMMSDLIDRLLQGLEAPDRAGGPDEGWRYAHFLEDPQALGLLLEDYPYRLIRAEVSLGEGGKSGLIALALPESAAMPEMRQVPGLQSPDLAFAAQFLAQIDGAESRLDAVIGRLTLPLGRLAALLPGEVFPLPLASIDRIRLTGLDGRLVAEGRLGQSRGLRAVRIVTPAEPGMEPGQTPPVALRAGA